MKTRMRRTLCPGLVLLGILAAAGCGSGDAQGEATPADADQTRAPAVNVEVLKLEPRTLVERVQLSGELEPWVHVSVSAELGGRVEQVSLRE